MAIRRTHSEPRLSTLAVASELGRVRCAAVGAPTSWWPLFIKPTKPTKPTKPIKGLKGIKVKQGQKGAGRPG